MTQVDFYLLQQLASHDRLVFACRLAHKAFHQQQIVYLHTDSESQSQLLEQLLWTYRPDSFLPHELASDAGDEQSASVIVGHSQPPAHCRQVMINLSSGVPDFFSRFDRLVEVVVKDADITAKSRVNYRFYQDRGYPLDTHHIS